jgi:phenylacetic acid degradation operon negative regulatory protein
VPRVLQPQELALTIFGAYLREPDHLAWSGGMVELLGDFGFSTEAARAALNRLAGRRLITRVRRGREVHYRLTARAQELLEEGDRRIFGFGREPAADGWTVLWHFLPDQMRVERSRLATRLRFLGFGAIQDATWVAPHDREHEVQALVRSLGIADHTTVMIGEPVRALGVGGLIANVWDLAAVADGYEAFVEEFQPYRQARARQRLSDREAFRVRTGALHQFRRFPSVDPELPDELMVRPKLRPRAVETFDAVYHGLREPAARHVAAVTRSGELF